jgi:hypothetical protein
MKNALVAVAVLALAAVHPAFPGGSGSASASGVSCCEPPARWGARHDAEDARIAITTENGDVTLLLTRRVVALQLSERCFHKVNRELRHQQEEEDNPIAEAIQTVVIGSVRALLDHSAECSIRELRDVSYHDGRLVFVTEDGERLFDNLEIDDSDVMASFPEREARDFVSEFRRLKSRTR